MIPQQELIPFVAESAADAVRQIRSRLGPAAVVVNVRPLPAKGLNRLWRKQRFEVLAHRPDANPASLDLSSDVPAQPHVDHASHPDKPSSTVYGRSGQALPVQSQGGNEVPAGPIGRTADPDTWRVGEVLQQSGFLPAQAQRVVDQLCHHHGPKPPPNLGDELRLSRQALTDLWKKPQPFVEGSYRPHVLIGPPGSGKTTSLCKWLTQSVLVDGQSAQVWRLDGATANTAEALSVYCEILGVPVERSWQVDERAVAAGMRFIDLPGVDWKKSAAIRELAQQLRQYLSPHIHLVLNGAYDINLLLSQARAFSLLPIEDVIITHLDEESRWGKIWNLVLGTNYSVRFLSSGQNIPGEFVPAHPDRLFSRQFPA